jgi:glycosyltransferase involved in cell wall biosynthesis
MKPTIDFTVVLPVFNTLAPALLEAVYSVHPAVQTIEQKYRVCIIDDGSTDAMTKRMLDFLAGMPYVDVWPLGENYGTPTALNYAHEHIKTDWIRVMGSDDIAHANALQQQVAQIERSTAAGEHIDVLGQQLFSFQHSDIARSPRWTSAHPWKYEKPPYHENFYTNHGTAMMRREIVPEVGGYNPKKLRAQDVDLWGRLIAAGKQIRTMPGVLYAWRRFQ